jgi:hypothetical protein
MRWRGLEKEAYEGLELVIDKLRRTKIELLSILKALSLSEEELEGEVRKTIEEAREELSKKES